MQQVKNLLSKIKKETWFTLSIAIVFLLAWELAVAAGWIESPFLPAPSEIADSAIDMAYKGDLQRHLTATLGRLFTGFLIGTAVGLLLGYAAGWSKTLRILLDPFITVIYPIPKIAILPLIMLVIGIGEHTLILVIAVSAFFPVLINCIAGVLNVNPVYFELARNYGAKKRQILTHVIIPGSLPLTATGIRLALALSLIMTIVVELTTANEGLGALLWNSWSVLKVEQIFLAVFIIAILSLILNPMIKSIISRLTPWQISDNKN